MFVLQNRIIQIYFIYLKKGYVMLGRIIFVVLGLSMIGLGLYQIEVIKEKGI